MNGTSIVNVDFLPSASAFPVSDPLRFTNVVTTGFTTSITVPIAQLNGPAPSNNLNISFNINMYLEQAGVIGNPIQGQGGVVQTGSSYYVVFTSYTDIPQNTVIVFNPFQFSYQ